MNENPILLPAYIYIFPPLLYPKIFPPPTYHLPTPPPLTPSPELQRRRAGASLEQGSLEQELGARERLESEQDPRGTHVSILLFFFRLFCLFVELRCTRYAALQRSITKKATVATLLSPSSSSCGAMLQCCCHLLLPAVELRCSTAPRKR